jgi:diguanylate cyclase (GGDEF)-like protein
VFAVVDEGTGLAIPDPVARSLRERCIVKSEGNVVLRPRNDTPVAVDYSVAPIRNRLSDIVGAVLVFHDMSRERQYAARLAHLASHDPLTGLLNRREFERRLTTTLAHEQHEPFNHAVLYLDLDQFKVVNDTCGHAAGDELLRQVTGLFRPLLREGDTLARLGGDEFGVLLEHCPTDPALRIAETLRTAVADFRFVWKNRSFNGSVSVGLVNISDGPQTLAGVLSAADAACYMAKDKGRNRVQVYSPNSNEVTARHDEMEWVNRIQLALAENRFCLYAQPVCVTRGDRATRPYTELLLRMRDEQNELIQPIEFIPAAERYNLMSAIDRWVLTTAFAILAQNIEAAADDEVPDTIAINISGASIGDDDFLDFVREQFARFKIPHSLICFEITETTAVTSLSKATEFMVAMQAQGCRFALDDFGAGVSSFTYLKHLPVDFVKIDGSFVKDMLQNPVDHAMVEAIHNIGHILGKKTIAESVESIAILDALGVIGVDYAQGFAVARPEIFGQLRRLRGVPRHAAAA